jgi:alpha-beta hydrolase superfamily lysophospholipase
MFLALAEDFTICVADLGYTTGADRWGDALNQSRIASAKTLLNGLGATGAVTLVTASHGNLGAMNYARNNPSAVTAIAAITPALSLNSIKQYNGGQYAADIDSRYGGNYTDATYGNSYSPHYYRASYPASSVETALWTAPNDAVVLNSLADAFVDAHIVNGRSRIRRYDLGGGLGHGEAALAAAVPGVVDWLRGNRDKD